jgi:hypothetical protein
MKKLIAAIMVLCLCLPALAQKQAAPPSEYATLAARVKSGDMSVDFKRLRFSYMESPEYKAAKDTSNEADKMFAALDAKKFDEALKDAEVVLAGSFVDIDGHFVSYIAHRELQHTEQAEGEKAIVKALLKSITGPGDGKSEETAWEVINVHEEYVVLRFMGLSPVRQSVRHSNEHSYDVMEAKDAKTGETVTLYFNVDVPFKHYGV